MQASFSIQIPKRNYPRSLLDVKHQTDRPHKSRPSAKRPTAHHTTIISLLVNVKAVLSPPSSSSSSITSHSHPRYDNVVSRSVLLPAHPVVELALPDARLVVRRRRLDVLQLALDGAARLIAVAVHCKPRQYVCYVTTDKGTNKKNSRARCKNTVRPENTRLCSQAMR